MREVGVSLGPFADSVNPFMIHRAYHFARREAGTFGRFLIVGGLSFLINIGVYAFLSRWAYPEGSRLLESIVANGIAILFNFLAHRAWTYQADHAHVSQMIRYGVVVAGAAALQAFLFWFGHDRLGFNDYLVIVVATGICAACTFFAHRFFTFRRRKDVV